MIEQALAASAGKVFGPGGAAERLGLKPTTLASRIKRYGLQKRRREDAASRGAGASVEPGKSV
jgi:transcriptional regulator with GAF, ATPase, and Fis domain